MIWFTITSTSVLSNAKSDIAAVTLGNVSSRREAHKLTQA